MTPETLNELVAKKDIPKFVEALAPLDEKQRKELWPACQKLMPQTMELLSRDRTEYLRRLEMTRLAYAGIAPRDELIDMCCTSGMGDEKAVSSAYGQVLADRNPPWLDRVLEHE